jgi:hypothetical protein
MAKPPATIGDPTATPEAPAFSPEQAVEQVARWGSALHVDGDRIMIRGHMPAWLSRDLQDPASYAALHAHLSEVARQEAERAAEQARIARQNDFLARVAYGSAGGAGLVNAAAELQRTELELAKRKLARRGKAKQ